MKLPSLSHSFFQQEAAGDHRPRAAGEDPRQLILVGGVMDSTSPPRTAVRAVKSRRRKPSSYPCQSPLSWGVPRRRATSTRFFRMGRRKGLGDVVVRPQVKPFQHILLQVVGGEEEDGEVGVLLLHLPAQVEAAAVGEVHVKESQVEGLLLQQLAGPSRSGRPLVRWPQASNSKQSPALRGQVIFQHQDVCHGGTSLGVLSYGGIIPRF